MAIFVWLTVQTDRFETTNPEILDNIDSPAQHSQPFCYKDFNKVLIFSRLLFEIKFYKIKLYFTIYRSPNLFKFLSPKWLVQLTVWSVLWVGIFKSNLHNGVLPVCSKVLQNSTCAGSLLLNRRTRKSFLNGCSSLNLHKLKRIYIQLSLRRTPLGPALSVRLREVSVL